MIKYITVVESDLGKTHLEKVEKNDIYYRKTSMSDSRRTYKDIVEYGSQNTKEGRSRPERIRVSIRSPLPCYSYLVKVVIQCRTNV